LIAGSGENERRSSQHDPVFQIILPVTLDGPAQDCASLMHPVTGVRSDGTFRDSNESRVNAAIGVAFDQILLLGFAPVRCV